MKLLLGLLVSSAFVLLGVMYTLSDPVTMSTMKPVLRFIWAAVAPVATMCSSIMTQVSSVIDIEDIKSSEHAKLKLIVDSYTKKLWHLQIFYIISSVFVLAITFITIDNFQVLLILTSLGITLIYVCLFTVFKLIKISRDVINLKAKVKNRKIKSVEIKNAIEKLDKKPSYTEEELAYLKEHNKKISIKQSKR